MPKSLIYMLSPDLRNIVEYLTNRIEIDNYKDFVLDKNRLCNIGRDPWSDQSISLVVLSAMQHLHMPFEIISVSIAQGEKNNVFYVSPSAQVSRGTENSAGAYSRFRTNKQITLYYNNHYRVQNVIAIILHEVTHHFLYSNGIVLPQTDENERMTDAAAVMLGFGQYMIHGYEDVTWEEPSGINRSTVHTIKLGYLSPKKLEEIQSFRSKFLRRCANKSHPTSEKTAIKKTRKFTIQDIKNKFEKIACDKESTKISDAANAAKKEADNYKMLITLNESVVNLVSASENIRITAEDVSAVSQAIYTVQSGINRERQASFFKRCNMTENRSDVQYFIELKAEISKACEEIAVCNKVLSKYI